MVSFRHVICFDEWILANIIQTKTLNGLARFHLFSHSSMISWNHMNQNPHDSVWTQLYSYLALTNSSSSTKQQQTCRTMLFKYHYLGCLLLCKNWWILTWYQMYGNKDWVVCSTSMWQTAHTRKWLAATLLVLHHSVFRKSMYLRALHLTPNDYSRTRSIWRNICMIFAFINFFLSKLLNPSILKFQDPACSLEVPWIM